MGMRDGDCRSCGYTEQGCTCSVYVRFYADDEMLALRYEALKAHTSLDFCDFCWEGDEREPMPQDQLWDCTSGDTGLSIKLCDGCYESSHDTTEKVEQ